MAKRLLLAALLTLSASAQQFPSDLFQPLRWRNIGPFRGGRTRAAAGVPSQPNVFYVGHVNGGVWKSDDYGRTWLPIFDAQPTQSIGAIAVAPSDPNIVYVGSGEGLQRPDLSVGDGIYRSADAGRTWTHLGLRDGQQIPALAVDPRNPNHVYAAVLGHPYGSNAERGLYVSSDGGATWAKSLYIDENTGASSVEMDPLNPDILYASMWEARQGPWEFGNAYAGTHGGLFKTTDGGRNWRKVTAGLPAIQQVYVAIAPSDPRRVYAVAASAGSVQIFRSNDAGESWSKATEDTRPAGRIGGGDLPVPKVDPKNPDVVYSTSTVTWRSTDGAKTWTGIKGAPGGDDYQNIWINPTNPDVILLVSDQGAAVSVNHARTWSSWYNQPTAQVYHAIATNDFPYRVCGGQQESGSVCVASRGNDGAIGFREWHPVGVIEYGYVAPDPLNPDIIYGAGRGQVSKHFRKTGEVQSVTPTPGRDPKFRSDRTQPIMFSPVDPHLLYYAANVVFQSTDGAQTWKQISPDLARPEPGVPASLGQMAAADRNAGKQRGVIYSLAPSFRNTQTIWAGTDEGLIHLTRDGGLHWKDVSPKELEPWSKVTQLVASHFDDDTAYASVSRFRVDNQKPYILRTRDGGKTWTSIVTGITEDAPINTVREDSVRKGLLFAGTEKSVWVSFDAGDHWQPLQLNLPHTSMRDLWLKDNDLIVGTHGRSFWILDDITPLRQVTAATLDAKATLFKPGKAVRVRWNTNTDTPLPPDEPVGENPPDGVAIDYFLKDAAKGVVTLEIVDAAGKTVRKFTSNDKVVPTPEAIAQLSIPAYWPKRGRTLSSTAGMHRWIWDLHYRAPDSSRHDYPIAAIPFNTPRLPYGPRALPGVYTVKLTVDGEVKTAPLTVTMDPRVTATPASIRRLFDAQVKLAGLMSRTTEGANEARSIEEQVAKLTGIDKAEFDRNVKAQLAALTGLNGQASALYKDLDGTDSGPTAAQTTAIATIARNAEKAIEAWESTTKGGVTTFNVRLKAANLPELKVAQKELDEEEDGDDDDIG